MIAAVLLIGLILAASSGDAEQSKPALHVPLLGLYGVEPESFEEVAAAGFNIVHTYRFETSTPDDIENYTRRVLEYLDAAREHGLRVLVGLPRSWILSRDWPKIQAAVVSVRHHSAILAWYEEEQGQQGHVGQVKSLNDLLEQLDPEHGLIIEENRRPARLRSVGRARMFTYYPVGPAARRRNRLSSIVDRFPIRDLCVPFFPVLQAYGQDAIAGCELKDFALPTRRELQYTLYSAVVHGASGVFFYTYRHPTRFDAERKRAGRWPYTDYERLPRVAPSVWASVLSLVAEAKFLLARTTAGREPLVPVTVEHQASLESAQWEDRNENLLVLANGRYEPQTVAISVPPRYTSWAVLHPTGVGSLQEIRDGRITVEVPGPGGVAVFFVCRPLAWPSTPR